MIFNKKKLMISILFIILYFITYYITNMDIKSFNHNISDFNNQLIMTYSYYESNSYIDITLIIYLGFIRYNLHSNNQRIIRMTKKEIAIENIYHLFIYTLLFIFMYYLIGLLFPILTGVCTFIFFYSYTLQCIALTFGFMIYGLLFSILSIKTHNVILVIGIPYIITLIPTLFDKYSILSYINYCVFIIDNRPLNNVTIIHISILILLFILSSIRILLSSKEDYL